MMDAFLQGRRFWEKNGNIVLVPPSQPTSGTSSLTSKTSEQGCAIQNMGDSDLPSQNNSCFGSDWNSNQFLATDEKKTEQKTLGDSMFEQLSNANKEYLKKSPTSPAGSPTGLFGAHQKDLSYDDLSKNIDANLAEIDMETFRSEDINSILALPAIYSGDFQSASHGEQCASVSNSLLNGLGLDTSTRSNRHSEDEISICKDEPLFSPLREPPVPEATISVDSLDNSSSYDQDLVLTCQANKNNYTIVFEGSSTQFSDDSDYQDVCKSSECESSLSGAVHINYSSSFKKQSSMVQSDVAFTTWSKLWRSHRISNRRRSDSNTKISIKSQSLPNLSHNPVFITDKQLTQWAKWCGNHRFPLYEVIQNYQASGMHVANSKECLHSVSLLKLFMKHKVSSNSSIVSSGQSDSSTSLILQPLNFRNTSLQNSLNISDNKIKPLQMNTDDTPQNQKEINRAVCQNDNDTLNTQMFVDNIKILDWNAVQNITETNNNNINSLYNTDNNVPNNNNIEEIQVNGNVDDCDNSQCFEDSLMDAQSPPLKHFHATPIKEEEETDISSGDEVMRDSKNPFGSDESTGGDITVIQNNTLDHVSNTNRQENGSNLERINNIFPSCKLNVGVVSKTFPLNREDHLASKKSGVPTENHSQSTQTKQFNINDCSGSDGFKPLHAFSCKTSSNQTDCDTVNTGHYSTSRDSSPASSGYVSSRHSSVERLRHSSQNNNANHTTPVTPVVVQKSNVVLTTTCTCGTQIPVHVKDSSVQTSTLYNSNSSSGFTLKESSAALPEPNQFSQTAVKCPLQNVASQTKHNQKDKKSIYVCYPNYSLPDLSFLKSIIEENSESVFLAPTEYKLPQDILGQKRTRPKSYGVYESLLQKHLTKIKDWESLNVLLPDDLKILISKTHAKGVKVDSPLSKEPIFSKNRHQNLSSSYCNADDATKLKTNFTDISYKRHMPRSILRKSSSVEQCEDRQCRVHLPTRCTSASSVICGKDGGNSPDNGIPHYKQGFCDFFPKNIRCPDSKCSECIGTQKPDIPLKKFHHNFAANISSDLFHNSEAKHNSSNNYKPPSPLRMHPDLASNSDKKSSFSYENCRDENVLQDINGKNIPYSLNNENVIPSFDAKNNGQNVDSHMNCFHSKKAVKFCEKSPTKNTKHLESCKVGKCCNCDTQNRSPGDFHSSQCSCDICNLESDKPPQEFLVSPTQNSLLYPDITDSYTLQNFSGGGKFFQEALRRKTGLVENLRKATQIICEHYKSKKGGDCGSSFSMAQKILTWLCPAVHTILSDGLLPSVQGFFGPLPNSPWKVAGASIKQGETRKEVEDLLNHVNSEKLLTDSTYRFNAFIIGLLNLGCFEWWLGHLCACQSLICHHYHPTALLSLLALPAAVHLRQELKELVSPLSNLSFNLDIIFETKVTAGDNWKKFNEGNFRPGTDHHPSESKTCKDHNERNVADLNLQFSPYKQTVGNKINDFNLKTKHNQALSPCNNIMNIRSDAEDCHENQVWPGITINPFPNAKFAEEFNITSQGKKEKNHSGRNAVPFNFLRDTLLPRDSDGRRCDIPHFSLCSSTDSGCSSQIDHTNHMASPANMTDESPNVDVKEGQQFKMLRQKWEKISHGINKQPSNKTPSPKAAKPTIASSSKVKKKLEISPPRSGHNAREIAVPKTPTKSVLQTPPSRRAQGKTNLHAGTSNDFKTLTSDIAPSSQNDANEKRKSQIPTLKFNKSPQVKSMIPVQKLGARARSANRDSRFPSD